ncbi:MAG TPA: G1 family glutamic endopeptidase [Streptosporangiaceae bacterium]|nr:G1 family glutamic endopeptidase [Streptosporangiaceae bacterium]
MRVLRYFLVSGSAAVVAGSLTLATQATVTTAAAPDHAITQPSARFLTQARAALVSYLSADQSAPPFKSGDPGSKTVNEPASALADTSASSSFNWSGYADVAKTANTFTKVSGQWKTPRVRCSREDQLTSEWVGIDGYSNATVEQDGTLSWCFEGQATYFTWYEMYPASTVEVGNSLHPGDKIAASVTRTGTSYNLALTDFTHPVNSFSVTKTCTTCQNSSVEWIAERPSFAIGVAPLARYGTWSLSKASQTAGSKTGAISGYPTYYKIDMVDATNTYPLSLTSGLNNAGNAFLTHWTNSY